MAVSFDAYSTSQAGGSGGPTYSWTHTPAGTPTAVGVWITVYNGVSGYTPSSVTYGGVTMTLGTSVGGGAQNDWDFLYSLPNPPSGAQTVQITFGGTGQYYIAAAVTVIGSSLTTCFRNVTNVIPSGSPMSTPIWPKILEGL